MYQSFANCIQSSLFRFSPLTSHSQVFKMTRTTEASLPAEIWIQIFNKIDTFKQLVECSLVNSKWKQLTEEAVSSRHINLNSESEAYTIFNLLGSKPEANQLIKHLTMMPKYTRLEYFRKAIPLVINRNMKTFDGFLQGSLCFKAMFDKALDKEGFACLSNLKAIPSPWDHNTYYDNLLHLLRNTLVEVTLNFRSRNHYSGSNAEWTAHRYLNKFDQLNVLTFNSYVHDVRETEAILNNCLNLRHLTIHLGYLKYSYVDVLLFNSWGQKYTMIDWNESTTQQCDILKTLKIILDGRHETGLVDYLMYKYPNTKSIIVDTINTVEPWRPLLRRLPLEIEDIKDVLGKIERVPDYTLKCQVAFFERDAMIEELEAKGYTASYQCPDLCITTITVTKSSSSLAAINSDTFPPAAAAQQLAPLRVS